MMGWSDRARLESPGSGSHLDRTFRERGTAPCRDGPPASQAFPEDFAVFLISSAFAQTAAPAAASASDNSFLFMLIPMFAIMYFLVIRPQQKRAKEQKELIAGLAKGDEVVTTGGVIGRISKLGESYVHIETGGNVELQIQRSAIVQVLPKGTLK
jgi:preprotein translocase subunit YajC